MSRLRILAAAAVTALSIGLVAADRPGSCPASCLAAGIAGQAQMVQKVYAVADLVERESAGKLTCSHDQELLKLVTSTVQPGCWAEVGGVCCADYFPTGMALVVNAPECVHKEVCSLLESLRKLQDVQVVCEMRFITVPDRFLQATGFDFTGCSKPRVIRGVGMDGLERLGVDFECVPAPKCQAMCLNGMQVVALLEAIQAEKRACVLSAPRLCTMNGQAARILVRDVQTYVTGVNVEMVEGVAVATPKEQTTATGLSAEVRPIVSADKRFVNLAVCTEHVYQSRLSNPIASVTTTVPAVDRKSQPVPFTHVLHSPEFRSVQMKSNVVVPHDGTVVCYIGKIEREVCRERGVPMLAMLPALGKMFRTSSCAMETEHMLGMYTVKIVCPTEPVAGTAQGCCTAARCFPTAQGCCVADRACCGGELCYQNAAAGCREGFAQGCCVTGMSGPIARACFVAPQGCAGVCQVVSAQVAAPRTHACNDGKSPVEQRASKMSGKLVQKYHEACAEGDMERARKLGRQALDLDPGCFGKPLIKQTFQPMPQAPIHLTPDRVHGGID